MPSSSRECDNTDMQKSFTTAVVVLAVGLMLPGSVLVWVKLLGSALYLAVEADATVQADLLHLHLQLVEERLQTWPEFNRHG